MSPRILLTLLVSAFGFSLPALGQVIGEETAKRTSRPVDQDISTTFSIVAADPEMGVCGAAVASFFPGVGKVVPFARGGVGAFCTQWRHVPPWGKQALDLLAEGRPPEEVLTELLRGDNWDALPSSLPRGSRRAGREFRQLIIIDMKGRVAVNSPTSVSPQFYWGAMTGRFYACQGGIVTRNVIFEMARAYEETEGSLADRLTAALLAGDCAGGDERGRDSAAIRVAKEGVEGYWLELQVEGSDDAVIELAKKYAELKHDAKGNWMGGKLPFKHPCPTRRDANGPDTSN